MNWARMKASWAAFRMGQAARKAGLPREFSGVNAKDFFAGWDRPNKKQSRNALDRYKFFGQNAGMMNEQEKQAVWQEGFDAYQWAEFEERPFIDCPYDDETEEEKFNLWNEGFECATEEV